MKTAQVTYALDAATSSFVIEEYNWAKPFSSFFPGIAGLLGVPLWAFYVNRGQAVVSMGVRDKDGQILEFDSFNRASARVAREGYRTLLRVDEGLVYEPFRKTDDPAAHQSMVISLGELTLRERHDTLGLDIEVRFFPLPGMPLAAMVRQVRVRNLQSSARSLEWVDGAARVLPYGLDQQRIKGIPRHVEAMMGVFDHRGVPLFRLKQTPDDSERIGELRGGTFFLAEDATLGDGLVVDPEAVFGDPFDLDHAWVLAARGADGVLEAPQMRSNRTPCALAVRSDLLGPHEEVTAWSLLGHVERDEDLDALIVALEDDGFLDAKRAQNADTLERIASPCFTVSSSPELDAYSRQDFLDNVMRGGMPLVFDTAGGRSVFHVYSRQNGDLERDYHFFVLEPTYLSQGTGHYRSVLQNRRTDSWFFPEVQDANLTRFLDLVQLDGYNPLEVNEVTYRVVDDAGFGAWLASKVPSAELRGELSAAMGRSFTPGWLAGRLERGGMARDRLLGAVAEVLAFTRENEVGGLHEGFWVDHWHYTFDLVDVFRMVYPDRMGPALLADRRYRFFDDPDVILPRSERIVDAGRGIRAYGAVVRDEQKVERIRARSEDAWSARTEHGLGAVYRTSLLVKLLTIVTNRLATLDPLGVGIEMEAGKPGWNDSMNGLPGLLGSGLPETLELCRAVRWLADAVAALPPVAEVAVFEELWDLMGALGGLIRERNDATGDEAALLYWDRANTAKETYRERTRLGVSGREHGAPLAAIRVFLGDARTLLDRIFEGDARSRAVSPEGVPYTYFVNEVVRWEPLGRDNHQGYPLVRPLAFAQRPVKLFLEGPVHFMKDRPDEARAVHRAVVASALYDEKLRMFKSCEDLSGEPYELGRAVGAYPRGWIENESIYLHMEFKYLLELLRAGLAEEFWAAARTALMPFLDPQVYGRSTLEGASFIVSSAYADPRLHGQAFQPRLSGITVEYLHQWILAMGGLEPFRVGEGGLELALRPAVPGWLFTEQATTRSYHDGDGVVALDVPAGALAFKLLGHTLVVYHNPERRSTWGDDAVSPVAWSLTYRDGRVVDLAEDHVPAPHAEAVREGAVRRMDVTLG